MKLRNRKTDEIIEFDALLVVKDARDDATAHLEYSTLDEFNEEWEDYEEPKEYWYVTESGAVSWSLFDDDADNNRKQIGNYFSTREEAERAVEKLKAWKRLRTSGFRFSHHSFLDRRISYKIPVTDEQLGRDLDTLFGGEDE